MSMTGLAFLLVFLGMLGLAAFRHPIWGLHLYIALFYIHPPSRWWGETLPDLRWSLLAALVTFVAILARRDISKQGFFSQDMTKTWLFFVIWVWITSLWALNSTLQMNGAILFTKYLLMWFLFYCLVRDMSTLKGVLVTHVLGCFALGVLAWMVDDGSGRLEGVGGPGINESNSMAMQMGTGACIAGMLILVCRDWIRYAAAAASPFILNTIILSGSRGAFLAVACAGIVMYAIKPKRYRWAFVFFGSLAIVAFVTLTDVKFIERITTINSVVNESPDMDTSAQSRFVILEAQWQMAKDYPFGVGHRGTALLSGQYMGAEWMSEDGTRGSHNTIMTVAVDQGLPGLLLYFILLVQIGLTLLRQKRLALQQGDYVMGGLLTGIAGALAVVMVGGIFVDYQKAEIFFWMVALLMCTRNIIQPQQNNAVVKPNVAIA